MEYLSLPDSASVIKKNGMGSRVRRQARLSRSYSLGSGVLRPGAAIVTALSTRTSARVFSSRTSRLMFPTVSQAW